jgi:hypothetical protein
MLIFYEYQSIMIFCEEPIKVAHCKKEKSSFGMHSQLINMDLQKGMAIRCVGID